MAITVTTTGIVAANADTTTTNTTNTNGAAPLSTDRIQLFDNDNPIVGTVGATFTVSGAGLELLQQSATPFNVSMANSGAVTSTLSGLAAMQLTGNGGDVTYTGTATSAVTGTGGASGLALNNVAAGLGTVSATVNGDVSGGVGIVATQFAAGGTGNVLVEVGTTTATDITGTGTAGYTGPGPTVDAGNGIFAKNYGDAAAGGGGNAVVTLGTSSTVSATDTAGNSISGILAESLSGDASVTTGTNSSVTVTGSGTGSNSGIYAASGATGAAGFPTVQVQTGDNSTITVNGGVDNSGIFARNESDLGVSDGNISITTGSGSTINVGNLTPSTPGEGIGAYTESALTTTTDISILANGGGAQINVTGNNVAGINAHQRAAGGSGDVSVTTNATGGTHTINVTDDTVGGTGSFGINATNAGTGTVSVTSASTINALGAGAADVVGINAAAGAGVITVEVNGAIAAATGTGVSVNGSALTNTIDATAAISGATGIRTAGGTTTLTSAGSTTITGTTAALDIDSGTLVVGAGTISLVGNVSDDGVLRINRATAFSVAGDISGTGSFEQTGAGTTTLTGTNTYAGGTTISAGTLQLGNGSTTGSITGNVVDNAILAINRSNTFTFAGDISGTGALQQNGTGTTILTATSGNTYAGATTINAGTLQVDGSITSATTVNSTGTLGGSGTVGTVTVNSGGTLAPGASAGVLTEGTLNLMASATLEIEIEGAGGPGVGGYDQVVVNGDVTLTGSILSVLPLGGFHRATGDTLTIILNNGTNAVTGTFANVGATFTQSGNTFSITYTGGGGDNNDVVLTALNDGPATDLNGVGGGDDNTASFTEQTPVLIAPVATITDADDTNMESLTATLTNRPDGAAESLSLNAAATAAAAGAGLTVVPYVPGTGVLSITGPASKTTYETILRGIEYNNTSDTPTTTARNVDVAVNDGDASSPINNVTISVTAANDPPVTDLNGTGTGGDDATASFTEQTPVVIAPVATITDVDDTDLESLTATLTNRPDGAAESLSLNGAAGAAAAGAGLTVVPYVPGTGVLSITGSASKAIYESILRGIQYNNTSDTPTTVNRIVDVVVDDGTDLSAVNTVTIGVTAVNDVPSTDLNGGTGGDDNTASFTEQTPVVIAPAGTITDLDDTNMESLTATLTTRFNGNAAESLSLNGTAAAAAAGAGLTVGPYVPATGVLLITGPASKTTYETILRGIQYNNTSDAPNLNQRTVNVVVNDGDASSPVNFVTINMSAVNDGPTNTTVPGAQVFNEDTATAFPSIQVADPDAAPQQIQVTLHVDNGILDVRTDVGGGVDAAHVTGDTTGTVTLLGTPAQINATLGAANGLTYQSNLNYVGADELDIITDDLGHTGSGGPLSDTDHVAITVNELDANTLTAVQTNAFAPGGDTDTDGVVDPGENIVTTVVITNNSETTAATGVTFAENVTGMLVTDINVQPLAGNDSYTAIGNTTLRVGGSAGPGPERFVTGSVLDNDVNLDLASGDSFTIDSHTLTSSGTLSFDNNTGTFVYNPNAGFTGTDTFTYTVRDEGLDNIAGNADDLFDTATVSITVTNMVWYVDSGAAINGDGTSDNPFNIITAANLNGAGGAGDLDAAGQYIYLKGSGNTAAFGLEATQHLIGTDAALVVNGFTLAAATGTRSTLTNNAGTTLTLASGNEVAGLNVNNTSAAGTALSGTNFGTATITNVALDATGGALNLATGTVAGTGFVSVDSDGGTNNVSLTGVSGTVVLGTGALAGATGAGFVVSGGNATVTFSGTMAHTSAGRLISVTDTTGGSVTFNNAGANALTDSGSGILIDGAAGNVTINNASLTGTKGIEILGDTANNATGTFTFNNVAIDTAAGAANHAFIVNGDVSGVAGNDVTGTIDLNNVDITNPGGNVANIAGLGGGSIDFDSASLINNTTGLGIVATSNSGGTITFGGTTKTISTGANAAVDLTSNTGAIINFTNGGLDIDTTTGTGFTATGGGTISVAGSGNSINSTGGPALDLNGVIVGGGNIAFASTDSGGGARGVNIDTVTGGSIALGTGTLAGQTAAAIDINAGNTVVTYGGVLGNGSGLSAEITNHSTGNITLSGNINDNADAGGGIVVTGNTGGTIEFSGTTKTLNTGASAGVTLTTNAGTTINFSGGGLDIDTTSGSGFAATGGATAVTVTGANNTILTNAGGTALNVASTSIGSAGLTFVSINASGASANAGIILNNTGTAAGNGGLTVTGTDGIDADLLADAGTGGTITARTVDQVQLTSTKAVNLAGMNITNGTESGVLGTSVTGLNLTNVNVTNNGDDALDEGIFITNLLGSNTWTNVSVTSSAHNNVRIFNDSGTLTALDITGGSMSSSDAAFGNDGLLFEVQGSATVNHVLINDVDFLGNKTTGIQMLASQTTGSTPTILGFTVQNSTFANNNIGMDFEAGGNANVIAAIKDNTIINDTRNDPSGANTSSHAINLNQLTPSSGLFQVSITGNTIGDAAIDGSGSSIGDGIRAVFNGNGTSRILIDDNVIREAPTGFGIEIKGRNGTGTTDITITNNDVDHTNLPFNPGTSDFPLPAISVVTSVSGIAGYTIRTQVTGNTVPAGTAFDLLPTFIEVFESASTNLQLVDVAPASASATAELTSHNTGSASANAGVSLIAGPINLPAAPALLAASGGVEAAAPADTAPPADVTPPADTAPPADSTPPQDNAGAPDAGDPPVTPPATPPAAAHPVIVDDGVLSQSELDWFVDAAIARWEAAGLTAEQSAALHDMTFSVADMPAWYLGAYAPGAVQLDSDGAGYGWFLDATPLDDSEFGNVADATRLLTDPTGAPAGHVDLLTTVMHEMGHQLGLEDTYSLGDRSDLMYGYLVTGERRLPGAGDADGAVAGSVTSEEFQIATINLGNLAPDDEITIQWAATITPSSPPSNNFNELIGHPTNTGGGTSSFGAYSTNPSIVTLDSLSLGDRIYVDLNGNQTYDAGEGRDGVTLTLRADTNGSGSFDAGDAVLGTTTTGGGGAYVFSGLAPGNYIVQVDAANFNPGGALHDGVDPAFSLTGAPDPDDNIDNDDNGASFAGAGVVSGALTLAYNTEPDGNPGGVGDVDGDADDDTNFTLDLGFAFVAANAAPTVTAAAADHTFSESTGAPVQLEPALDVNDDDDEITSATVVITNFLPGDQLLFTIPALSPITGSYNPMTGILTLSSAPTTAADYEAVLQSVEFDQTSDNPTGNGLPGANAQRIITWTVNDGTQDSAAADSVVNIVTENDAPVLLAGATPVLNAVNEDAGAPGVGSGTLISDLVNLNPPAGGLDNVTEPDGTTLTGIALTAVDTLNGTWSYTTDGGSNWLAVGAVSDDSARLLAADANTRLYFQPTTLNFNGVVANAITFRAWDRSSGTNGTLADADPNGGTTAFSTAFDTANITVTAVNDAPVLIPAATPVLSAVNEDAGAPGLGSGTLISALVDLDPPAGDGLDNVTDVDASPVTGIALTNVNTANGAWLYTTDGGSNWLPVGAVTDDSARLLAADANTRLYFQPNLNFNGTVANAITFRAWDQTSGTNGTLADPTPAGTTTAFSTDPDSADITVNAINDDPAAANVPTDVTVTEDVASNLNLSAITLTDVDSDPDDITLTLAVSAGTLTSAGSGTVTVGGSPTALTLTGTVGNIDAFLNTASNIQYTTVLNANGDNIATLTLTANDGGNNGAGGGGNVALGTVNIDSTAVNDDPAATGVPSDRTVTEDVASDLDLSGITLTDVDSDPDDITLTLTASAGTFTSAGSGSVTVGGSTTGILTLTGTVGNIDAFLNTASNIQYTTALNAAGDNVATVALTANDGGNNGAGGGGNVALGTVNIDSTAVNDAPVFADLDSTPTPTMTENVPGSPAILDSNATVSDPELDVAASYDGAQLALARNGGANADDVFGGTGGLVFSGTDVILAGDTVGTFAAPGNGTLFINFNGNATAARVDSVLQRLTYFNTSEDPPLTVQINYTFSDGNGVVGGQPQGSGLAPGIGTGSVTVNITPINDDPAATGVPSDRTVIEDVASNLDLSAITLTDFDSGPDDITLTLTASAGTFTSASGGSVTVGGSTTGTLTLTGTVGNIDAFLNTASNIQYTTALNANGDNVATVALTANDGGNNGAGGGGNVALGTVNIDSTAVNDAPVFAGLGPNPNFTENGVSTVLDNNAAVSDVELDAANNYDGAVLTLARNGGPNADDVFGSTNTLDFASGQVTLNGGVTFIGTATNADGTLQITFNANATSADVDSVLQQIIYSNVSEDPPFSVQINYTLSDGNAGSQGTGAAPGIGAGSVTVDITPINDRPQLFNVAFGASYTIGSPGTTLSAATLLSDVDSNLAGGLAPDAIVNAVVKIEDFHLGDQLFVNLPTSGGFFQVDDGATTTNIAVQSSSLGQLVLAGNDTPAHYQQVLAAVSYRSTNADPQDGDSDPNRVITWQVNDGTPATPLILAQTVHGSGVAPQSVAAADVNADGLLDLVTANLSGTVSVLLGTGGGNFGARHQSRGRGQPAVRRAARPRRQRHRRHRGREQRRSVGAARRCAHARHLRRADHLRRRNGTDRAGVRRLQRGRQRRPRGRQQRRRQRLDPARQRRRRLRRSDELQRRDESDRSRGRRLQPGRQRRSGGEQHRLRRCRDPARQRHRRVRRRHHVLDRRRDRPALGRDRGLQQ